MEIGLITSNIGIQGNPLTVASQENSTGQPKFLELMLGRLNQSTNGKTCEGFSTHTPESAFSDMEEVLNLYAGSMMNFTSSPQSSKTIVDLTEQLPADGTEIGDTATDLLGVMMQGNTAIQHQNQEGSDDLLLNIALDNQMTQSQRKENEGMLDQSTNQVWTPNIASQIATAGNEVSFNQRTDQARAPNIVSQVLTTVKPEMINNPGVTSNPESVNAPPHADASNVLNMATSQTGQFENIGNANQTVQVQRNSGEVHELELNHPAVALKAGPSGIDHNSAVMQNEPMQTAVKSQPYTQIEKAIAETLQNQGPKEFSLQLKPESLGVIDIKLKLEAGKMTIDIAAASAKTQALLVGQVEKLVQGLGLHMQNVQIENVQVSRQDAEPSSQLQNQSFTANENSDMFQRRQQQQMHAERSASAGNQSMIGVEPDLNSKLSFDEGAKYRLNYSV